MDAWVAPTLIAAVVLLALTLVAAGCRWRCPQLHGSAVGPEVYHPEVHTEVRRRWTHRIANEMDLSEYNLRHNPNLSNLFW